MRLQRSHRQRSILSQLVMKRAQINLWPPNFATGSVAWNDTGDQDFYDGSQLTV